MSTVAPELMPVAILEGDSYEGQLSKLNFLFSAQQFVAADAGNFSITGVRNPAGSGLLAVVNRLWLVGGGALPRTYDVRRVRPVSAAAVAAVNVVPSDLRLEFNVGTLQVVSGVLAAQPGVEAAQAGAPAGATVELRGQWVLPPNTELLITAPAINSPVYATLFGYYRRAADIELTP